MPALTVTSSLQVDLDLFQGPLHTLLVLIERRELPIARVSLVAVADQYVALVRAQAGLDLESTAEFLHIASRLLLLKSLALLPSVPSEASDRDLDIDADDLEARLLLYRRYRDAARLLAAHQEAGGRLFGRSAMTPAAALESAVTPMPVSGDGTGIGLGSVAGLAGRIALDLKHLMRAARRAEARSAAQDQARTAAPSPLVSFALVLQGMVERLAGRRHTRLHDVIAEAPDVITAVTMFLAVLELVHRRRVLLQQHDVFGPIDLVVIPEGD